jgi:hypothetical protein
VEPTIIAARQDLRVRIKLVINVPLQHLQREQPPVASVNVNKEVPRAGPNANVATPIEVIVPVKTGIILKTPASIARDFGCSFQREEVQTGRLEEFHLFERLTETNLARVQIYTCGF